MSVFDDAFWAAERQRINDELARELIEIILRGISNGLEGLPVPVQLSIDWSLVSQNAAAYIDRLTLEYIGGITDTTRAETLAEIEGWLLEGDSLPVLTDRLTPIFGEARAGRIAATETTRLFAEGNQVAWQASQIVSGKRWMTARDDLVCPICGPLAGTVAPLQGQFRGGYDHPPAHVNCRCGVQPVVSEALLRDRLRLAMGMDAAATLVDSLRAGGEVWLI